MNLQNGYTVLNEKITDGERTFIAKGPEVVDKEIGPFAIGEFKLVYEKDGQIYGSTTGIPTEDDTCFEAFDAIFIEEVKDSENETINPDNTENTENPENPEEETPVDPENAPTEDEVVESEN